MVALRKESVDRNLFLQSLPNTTRWSLSARRAWIEIISDSALVRLKESLSARRAWIEICVLWSSRVRQNVALRKESVDRNVILII